MTRDREAAIRYASSNVIDIDEMDDGESRELTTPRSRQSKKEEVLEWIKRDCVLIIHYKSRFYRFFHPCGLHKYDLR